MALIDCPECKRQVSSFAESCPGCGWPVPPARSASTTKGNRGADTDDDASDDPQDDDDGGWPGYEGAPSAVREPSSRQAPLQRPAQSKPVAFLPGKNVWFYLVGLVVVAILGWRVQRRYLPTCGQVASHGYGLLSEVESEMKVTAEGEIRQTCSDGDWTMKERRSLMATDTASQFVNALPQKK
jgi:hypothetical protein